MRSIGLVLMAAAVAVVPAAGPVSAATLHPYTWGDNGYGQLGNGTTTSRHIPAALPLGATGVSAGRDHGLAVAGGGAYAWGWNLNGQIGDGTTTNALRPKRVAGICPGSPVAEVAAGHYSSLARCADHTAWGWGKDDSGQLGNGPGFNKQLRPVRVATFTDLVQLAGGRNHSVGLRANGTVWAWGSNAAGQLGDGTFSPRPGPVQVNLPAGTVVTQVIAGRDHSLARTSTGKVYAWGINEYGELGDGTTTNRAIPVIVALPSAAKAVGAGAFHSLAVLSDGTVRAWGRNNNGRLGDGTTLARLRPVAVKNLTGVSSVAGARDHSLAVTTTGKVYAWGKNFFGQLGDGTTTDRKIPTLVPGLNGATQVSGGRSLSLALAP